MPDVHKISTLGKTWIFDLDGTIIDSGEGVTNSVAYALERLGIAVNDKSTLKKFIGPPLIYSFMTFYGFDRHFLPLNIIGNIIKIRAFLRAISITE